jgi:hypothetical protein
MASVASGSKRKAGGPAGADAVDVANGRTVVSSSENPSAFAPEDWDKAVAIMETEDMMHGAVTRAAGAAGMSRQQFCYCYRQWKNFHRYPSSVRGPPPSLGWKGEAALVAWIEEMCRRLTPPTPDMVRLMAQRLAAANKIDLGVVGGDTWWENFRRRHPKLGMRLPQEMETARIPATSTTKLMRWVTVYEAACLQIRTVRGAATVNPEWVWNVDECGIQLRGMRTRVLAPRGQPCVQRRDLQAYHLSLVACGNAAGRLLAPVLIFQGVRPMHKLIEGWEEACLLMSESGYQETPTWDAFIDFFLANVEGPAILVSDGHATRKSATSLLKLSERKVHLAILPPHTTHVTQPLDLSFFRALKAAFRKALARMQLTGVAIKKEHMCIMLKEAWEAATKTSGSASGSANVRAGFEAAGLFPLDSSKFINPDVTALADRLEDLAAEPAAEKAADDGGDGDAEGKEIDPLVVDTPVDDDETDEESGDEFDASPAFVEDDALQRLARHAQASKGERAELYTNPGFIARHLSKKEKAAEEKKAKAEKMEIKEINRAKKQADKKAKEDAKEAKKMMEEETDGDTDADSAAASKAFMAEVEEILAEARDRATPAGLIADKLINLRPKPGPVLSDKALLDWKVGSGRGVKVRMRYGGMEKEKKGEEGTSTYNATFRVEWEKAQEAKFRAAKKDTASSTGAGMDIESAGGK